MRKPERPWTQDPGLGPSLHCEPARASLPILRPMIASSAATPARPTAFLWLFLLADDAVQLGVHADRRVHEIYGFHSNRFAWNISTTRGDVESLGASSRAMAEVFDLVVLAVACEAVPTAGLPVGVNSRADGLQKSGAPFVDRFTGEWLDTGSDR